MSIFCDCNRWFQFSPCRVHRLHLHLWWSTSRRHQQFMLHLRLSWCTSRWHKQCLTPRKHKCWSTSRLRLQPTRPTTCSTSCVVRGYRTRASASHQQNRGHRPCNLSLYVVPPHSRFPLATLHLQRCCFGLPCLRVLKKQLFLALLWTTLGRKSLSLDVGSGSKGCLLSAILWKNFSTALVNDWVRDSAQLPEPLLNMTHARS